MRRKGFTVPIIETMKLMSELDKGERSAWEKGLDRLCGRICEKLPDISVTTVEAELARLMKSGEIEKNGNGRGTKYRAVIKPE